MYGRNHHNIVKHLSSNKNKNPKKGIKEVRGGKKKKKATSVQFNMCCKEGNVPWKDSSLSLRKSREDHGRIHGGSDV